MLNGLTIAEIERRCRPLNDKLQDPLWKSRSATGFLNDNETLIDVVGKDFQCLNLLSSRLKIPSENDFSEERLTNPHKGAIVIAQLIQDIISQTEEIRNIDKKGPMSDIQLLFDSKIDNSIPQRLTIIHNFFAGYQFSPFYNYDIKNEEYNISWNEDYLIRNDELNIEILIGGNKEKGIVSLIKDFGFFEGNASQNPYRLDPFLFFTCITGIILKESIESYKIRLGSKVNRLKIELEESYNLLKETEKINEGNEEILTELQAEKERITKKYNEEMTSMALENERYVKALSEKL